MSGSNPGDPPDGPGDDGDPDSRSGSDPDGDPTGRDAVDDPSRSGESTPSESTGPATERGPRGDAHTASSGDANADRVTIEDDGVVRWFLDSQDGNVVFARDVLSSVGIVLVIGLILFGVSGVWPPLVAVESGSMEPNMHRGDLIFVVDDDRFAGDGATEGTGVVTLENGQDSGHDKFGNPGDVIVFQPNGNEREVPIIHRAHFHVEEGEEWIDTKADEEIVGDLTCADVNDDICPAPHDGFITKGDANANYDQLSQRRDGRLRSNVVKSEWITGKAMFRIPWLGHIRLTFDDLLGGVIVPEPLLDGSPAGTATATGTTGSATSAPGAGAVGVTGLAGLAAGAGVAAAAGRYRD